LEKYLVSVAALLLVVSLGLMAPASAQTASFGLTVQPAAQTVSPGMSAAYSIAVTSSAGFTSPVTLSLSNVGSLPSSITVSSFYPSNVVTPPAGGSDFAILVIQTTTSTPLGTYQLTISGTGGGLTQSGTIALVVTDETTFAISAVPVSRTIGLGDSNQYQISVASLGDFSSPVTLSVAGLPYGVSYAISSSSVTPPAGGVASATLLVSVGQDAIPGDYALIVSGSSTGCTTLYYETAQCVDYSFVVAQVPSVTDFQINVSPSAQSVVINQYASFAVQVTSLGGFSSNVVLSLQRVPNGVSSSFTATTLTPTDNNPETSTLTLSPSTTAQPGVYSVDVVGTSGGVTKTYTISLTIMPIAIQLTLNDPITGVKLGDTFTVLGSVSPAQAGAVITIVFTRPDGSEFTNTVQTGSNGVFSDQYTPVTVDLVGSWKVMAEYVGTGPYNSSSTSAYSFQVVPKSFLEQYGLLWLPDYALWIALLAVAIVVITIGGIMAVKRASQYDAKSGTRHLGLHRAQPTSAVFSAPSQLPAAPTKRCVNCGRVLVANARFCDECAMPQPAWPQLQTYPGVSDR